MNLSFPATVYASARFIAYGQAEFQDGCGVFRPASDAGISVGPLPAPIVLKRLDTDTLVTLETFQWQACGSRAQFQVHARAS